MSQNTMKDSKKGRARRKNSFSPNADDKRRATIMKRAHMARKRGEQIEVTFDEKGQPEGKHDDELINWIGVLAREHVPIWIQDWRSRDLDGLKEIIWKETVTSFTVDDCFRKDSVWTRPQKVIDNYSNIEEEDWVKFVKYRTSSQFQQLSNHRSEIRTNNEYTSRGGRDGYRKLDQEKFKKTVKWEKRDRWSTTHPGRIHGQSKFVKQSQYFNLNRSSNRDNEVLSMRREIEELKALVHGLCAKKDVEPSFDQENVPTVDQHNSFKASCSVQEKQHGVSDPLTMPVDSQECKLYIFDELYGGQLLVAFGIAWLESLPTNTVHGIPLGEGNVRVSINVPKLKKATLPIPTYEATTVVEAVNGFVAWPKTLVKLDTSMNKQDAQQHEALFDFNKMNMEMRPLAYYAHSSMREGNQIKVPIPYTIMGFDMPVFLSFDDIYGFINLQEISANCILVYIRYLEELCRINGRAEEFVFVSQTLISPIRTDTADAGMRERADILVGFLRDTPKG
ncbi:hypothetical protein TIFTF001_032884 [Ficus carica]|uniref:DUF8039 domain-containing protein n=1 Tax=Ficus carica TaxID=3494 RepID=A0AA88DY35_FICCA|nr:hypothetical protein TIFTF001_032884 [Ficus carica]